MAAQGYVKFTVADLTFGIEIMKIHQIMKPQEIFKVPNTPPFIEGLLSLRGRVLVIFNLRQRFGFLPREDDEDTKIIIVAMNDLLLGFTVDSVTEIVRLNDDDLVDVPPSLDSIDRKYLSGVGKLKDKLMLILDLTKVLSSEEEAQMIDIIDQQSKA